MVVEDKKLTPPKTIFSVTYLSLPRYNRYWMW